MADAISQRMLGVVLFPGFELLDVFGPLEVFGAAGGFDIRLIGPEPGAVRSAQGPAAVADAGYAEAAPVDIVLVPGGFGNRPLVKDADFLRWLAGFAGDCELVTSVCTGSALLAAAGLLDGYRATSNKRSFTWVRSLSDRVEWVAEARWVEDRNRWTSSGVAAGIDMALALTGRLLGAERSEAVAQQIEYDPHLDPGWDPFAASNGLV